MCHPSFYSVLMFSTVSMVTTGWHGPSPTLFHKHFSHITVSRFESPHQHARRKVRENRGRKAMTRGKQKIEAQRKNAERNQKAKGSQLEARAVGLKVVCSVCKVISPSKDYLCFWYICMFKSCGNWFNFWLCVSWFPWIGLSLMGF